LEQSDFGNDSSGTYLTIEGRSVYAYIHGTEPNQVSGHDAGDVWFTIRADGELNQTP
jgi:streptogramin lyase